MGLSGRILVGLVLGIGTGVFFGELVADLKLVGDIFIKLLQITVLPYIVVSLIAGFGRMHMAQAKQLAVRGGLVLLVIWALALLMIFLASMAFPRPGVSGLFWFFCSTRAGAPRSVGVVPASERFLFSLAQSGACCGAVQYSGRCGTYLSGG